MEMPISKSCCFLFVLLTLYVALTVPSVAADDCANVWCVANPKASRDAQQKDIDVLCNVMNCGPIKSGGACFDPNTVLDHASFVFNTYFKDRACNPSSCNFGGDAMITKTNPSHGSCSFK